MGLARLNRPDARNALSPELMEELAALCERWDEDPEVGCIVIAGDDDWFAAGADIKAMAQRTFVETLTSSAARFWPRLAAVRTPLVAAVSGYALGGGCELALGCDMIVASEEAEFGQPEILLGIIPGGGGTQRLARVIGKQRAMELVLTGRRIDAPRGPRARDRQPPRHRASGSPRRSSSPAWWRGARLWRCDWPSRRCWPPTRRHWAPASITSAGSTSWPWPPRTVWRA